MAAELSIEQFVPEAPHLRLVPPLADVELTFGASEATAKPLPLELVPPLVQLVPEMQDDQETRRRAGAFAGAILAGAEVSLERVPVSPESHKPVSTLYEAVQLAADGDPVANRMIRANVSTLRDEQTTKVGPLPDIELQQDAQGNLLQHGHYMDSIQANTLRMMANGSPQMKARTLAENNNAFRMRHCFEQGQLEDNYFITISRAPDDMSVEQAGDEGFFTETMSMSIQATTIKNGRLTTEPVFFAGVPELGGKRHDARAVAAMAEWLGAPKLANLTATELLDAPLLVSKKILPNGAIDLVRAADEAMGTFFGEYKPAQSYQAMRQRAIERNDMLMAKTEAIAHQLISEVANLEGPVHTTERLMKITADHMVEQAIGDLDINPRVYGVEAAQHIERARAFIARGMYEEALRENQFAKDTAKPTGCPSGAQQSSGETPADDSNESSKSTEAPGDCEFISKECPKCHKKNVKTVISKGKITGACGCSAKLK